MKRLYNYFIFILILFGSSSFAQPIFEYKGYLQNMNTVWVQNDSDEWILSGGINNRFDFYLYPINEMSVNIGLRNIVEYGQVVQMIPGYNDFVTKDEGYFNLTKKWSSNKSNVFYSNIDRLNIYYSLNEAEFQLGRQRINLGVNMVWTPNDIFNSSSFLNFDYEEKPGSDALRAQYYFGYATSLQGVIKLNNNNDITAAGIFKFNEWNYDFQVLTGIMEEDYVFGGGWSGNISNANFSGEFTYFRDKDNFSDTTGIYIGSIGATYTFTNELYLHGEFLFNSDGKTGKAGGLNNIFTRPYNAKNLSPAKYSLFAQASYPVTPLIRADLSTIFNPSDKSFYLGPFVDISLTQTTYLLIAGQFFFGESGTEWGDFGQFYYMRIKWNF